MTKQTKRAAKTTKTIVKAKRAKRAAAKSSGLTLVLPTKPAAKRDGGSLQSTLDAWLAGLKGSKSYVANLGRRARHFVEWCAARKLTSVAKIDTAALLAYRKVYSTDRSVATVRMDLRRVLSFLLAQGKAVSADVSVLRVQPTAAERAAAKPAPKPADKADAKLRAVFKREQAAAAKKAAKPAAKRSRKSSAR